MIVLQNIAYIHSLYSRIIYPFILFGYRVWDGFDCRLGTKWIQLQSHGKMAEQHERKPHLASPVAKPNTPQKRSTFAVLCKNNNDANREHHQLTIDAYFHSSSTHLLMRVRVRNLHNLCANCTASVHKRTHDDTGYYTATLAPSSSSSLAGKRERI